MVDDLLQETLLRACRSRSVSDGDGLRPWLTALATLACVDVWRREPPPAKALDGVVDDPPAGPTTAVPGSDERGGTSHGITGPRRGLRRPHRALRPCSTGCPTVCGDVPVGCTRHSSRTSRCT